jgi:hypothetical protein
VAPELLDHKYISGLRPGFLNRKGTMPRYTLETILVIVLILWLLGAFIIPIAGNLIHLLLVVLLVVIILRVLQGRRPLP